MNTIISNNIIHEITPLATGDCFYVNKRIRSEFNCPIHSHDEYELNFIEGASGAKRVVGDSTEIIDNFDLVLITNKDLEHAWEQSECKTHQIHEITIHFPAQLLNDYLINKNQLESICKMFIKARNGLCFPTRAIMKVYSKLNTLNNEHGFYAFIQFLTILYELSLYIDEAHTLSSSSYTKVEPTSDSRRIQKIQKYINANYKERICLELLAEKTGMTAASFSRFFKRHTGKSLSNYIIDIRIGFASRLLVDTSMSIYEICYECGFNNVSYFNRIFRKKKMCSPKEFRENYHNRKNNLVTRIKNEPLDKFYNPLE